MRLSFIERRIRGNDNETERDETNSNFRNPCDEFRANGDERRKPPFYLQSFEKMKKSTRMIIPIPSVLRAIDIIASDKEARTRSYKISISFNFIKFIFLEKACASI